MFVYVSNDKTLRFIFPSEKMEKEGKTHRNDSREVGELPEDVLLFLFSFLDYPSLKTASLASQ